MLSRAFESWFVPFFGFFLLPWTTLAYAVMWSVGTHGVKGFEWFIVDPRLPLRPRLIRRGTARTAASRLDVRPERVCFIAQDYI